MKKWQILTLHPSESSQSVSFSDAFLPETSPTPLLYSELALIGGGGTPDQSGGGSGSGSGSSI